MDKIEIMKYVEEKNKLGELYYEKFIKTGNKDYRNKSIYEFEEVIKYKEYYKNMSGVYVTYITLMIHKLCGRNIDKKTKDKSILLSKENYEMLLEYNTLATKYRASNKVAPQQRILLHFLSGNYHSAIEDLKNINFNCNLEALFQFPTSNPDILLQIFFEENSEGYYNRDRILFLEEVLKFLPYQLDYLNILQVVHAMGEQEDYIRALDFYEEYLGKNPEQIIMCGSTISQLYGYLGNFEKQIEYAERTLKKLYELIKSEPSDKEIWNERIYILLDNISMGYIGKGEYKKALDIRKKIKENNNTYLHNTGIALYHNEQYNKAIKFFKKALYIYEDEMTLICLADCYVKMEDYDNALIYYKKALYFLNNEETTFTKQDNDMLVQSSITNSGYKNMLNKAYDGIVHTYININNLELAKVYNDLACKSDIHNTNFRSMKTVIDSLIKQQNIKIDMEKRLSEVKEELDRERNINKFRANKVRKWATQLFDAQDDISDIDEDWDKFENKILEVIEVMKEEVPKKFDINNIRKQINSKFYYLNEKSKQFLYTAEYLYNYNLDSIIDFAPIAVEYSKVIECQLNYIDKNRRKYEKEKTLGTILYNIDKINNKDIYVDLKQLVHLRNLSAHTGNCKKEDVDVIREIVYKLIPILNKVKKDGRSIIVK